MSETMAKMSWAEAWQAVAVAGWTGYWTMTLTVDGVRRSETFSRKSRPGAVEREAFLRRCGVSPK